MNAPRGDSEDESWVFEKQWCKYHPQGPVSTLTYLASTFLEEEYNPYVI